MAAWNGKYPREGGIDPDIFKDRVEFENPNDTGFKCPLCKKILEQALQMECGCRFCNGCMNDYICDQKEGLECPSCDAFKQHGVMVQPDFRSRTQVSNATVFCPNKKFGCLEEMKFQDLSQHIEDTCLYKACPHEEFGCRLVLLRAEIIPHIKVCKFVPIECRYCNQMTPADKIRSHGKKCKKKMQQCPNNCKLGKIHKSKDCKAHWCTKIPCEGQKIRSFHSSKIQDSRIKVRRLDDHLSNECALSVIACEFEKYGCSDKHKRRDMKRHLELAKDHHELLEFKGRMGAVEMAYEDQSKVIKGMKREMNELQRRLTQCECSASKKCCSKKDDN